MSLFVFMTCQSYGNGLMYCTSTSPWESCQKCQVDGWNLCSEHAQWLLTNADFVHDFSLKNVGLLMERQVEKCIHSHSQLALKAVRVQCLARMPNDTGNEICWDFIQAWPLGALVNVKLICQFHKLATEHSLMVSILNISIWIKTTISRG